MTLSRLRWFISIIALISLLSGCTHYVYGVPQDHWRVMSESDRMEVIRLYQERRVQEERRRAAEAEVRAMELETRRHAYPEVIYLHLGEGSFFYRGQAYRYQPQTFQLRHGETRTLQLVTARANLSQGVRLRLRYAQGRVMLGDDKRFSHVINYQDGWDRGEHYGGIRLPGALQFEDIELDIGVNPFVSPVMRDGAHETDLSRHGRAGREKSEQEKSEREKTEREKTEREKAQRKKAERKKAERKKAEREKTGRAPSRRERGEQGNIQTEGKSQEKHGEPSAPAETKPDECNGNRGNGENRNNRSPSCD